MKDKKKKKNEQSFKDFVWHHQVYQCKHNGNLRRREGKGKNNIWRNNGLEFPNLMKSINLHIQEAQYPLIQ